LIKRIAIRRVLLEQKSLDTILGIPDTICFSQDLLTTTMIEEKSEENGGRLLEEAQPQMLGECMAV
jgi:hypothetical protein